MSVEFLFAVDTADARSLAALADFCLLAFVMIEDFLQIPDRTFFGVAGVFAPHSSGVCHHCA